MLAMGCQLIDAAQAAGGCFIDMMMSTSSFARGVDHVSACWVITPIKGCTYTGTKFTTSRDLIATYFVA
jgi:hypothetical protein